MVRVGRLGVFAWEEWSPMFKPSQYNWIDIHWLWLHTEWSPYKNSAEINVGLLGFCVRIEWFYGKFGEAPHD